MPLLRGGLESFQVNLQSHIDVDMYICVCVCVCLDMGGGCDGILFVVKFPLVEH